MLSLCRYFPIFIYCIFFALPVTAATPFATRLTTDNIALLQPAGPDAIAGIGDWVLGNGTLCAAISDINHESGFTPFGGTLVDLHHCGKKDDQWTFQHALPNMDKDRPLRPVAISAETTAHTAAITVTAESYGLRLTSRYTLDHKNARSLHIEHRLTRLAEGEAVTMFGVLMLHPHLSLTPYQLATQSDEVSRGYNYITLDRRDNKAMVAAMLPAETHILAGSANLSQISYGTQLLSAQLLDDDGDARALPIFQLTDPTYSFIGVLSRPPWLGGKGKLGMLEMAQSQLMDIKPGEVLRLEQRVLLGARADVAAVTDQLYTGAKLSGALNNGPGVIEFHDGQNTPLSSVQTDSDGQFALRLPAAADTVTFLARTAAGVTSTSTVTLTGKDIDLGVIKSPATGFVTLPRHNPARLIFKGIGDTPDPDFNDALRGVTLDGNPLKEIEATNTVSLAGVASDPERLAIPPGRYRVLASRGMAYEVTEAKITVTAGAVTKLRIDPPMRILNTGYWMASDFHVHSAPSFDSYMPVQQRLRSFVAQGSDVLIASEHNVLVDYREDLHELGLASAMHLVGGLELTGMARTSTTPFTHGHLNVFPLQADPTAFAGGLIAHEGMRLRDIYASYRKAFGGVLFQLNHPRLSDPKDVEGDNAYFDHLLLGTRFDPTQSLDSDVNRSLIEPSPGTGLRDLDFDLMEIANGNAYAGYLTTRQDWFSLLGQGERIFGTANSDTHGSRDPVALPQTFVWLPGAYSDAAFIDAVRAGRMFGSTGPFIELQANTPTQTALRPGDTITSADFELNLQIAAASWVPVDQLVIYYNGEVLHQQPIQRGEKITLPLSVAEPGYLVVEVTGTADDLYSVVAPGFTPFAFSNPLFVSF